MSALNLSSAPAQESNQSNKVSSYLSQVNEALIQNAAHRAESSVHLNAANNAITATVVVVGGSLLFGLPGMIAGAAYLGASSAYQERAAFVAGKRNK